MHVVPQVRPVTLSGNVVRLEPLRLEHGAELLEAAREPSIWKYLTVPQPQTVEEMRSWIADALAQQEKGIHLPFAVVRLRDGQIVGTTRYLDIRPFDGSVEIGWTWYAAEAQRTAVNTECKFRLLCHAFDDLRFNRVQLKTDANNERSRKAIERIGGKLEGVLRNYQRYWHGGLRDTAMYGITDIDWPDVKARLETMVGARSATV